ncbi:MAG: hypothetical protein R3C99_07080 [Pirellulaceae bacterium]
MKPRSPEELDDALPWIRQSPKDKGVLRMIVVRPGTNERSVLPEVEISAAGGVHGDCWASGCWKSLPDGRPHPDVQIAMMNVRVIEAVAGPEERWPLAGDNLFVDLDLGSENLAPGQRLEIGSAVIEITDEPHLGCRKFQNRFGVDALRFVNSPLGKQLHLRGIYAKVVTEGMIRAGDVVKKID